MICQGENRGKFFQDLWEISEKFVGNLNLRKIVSQNTHFSCIYYAKYILNVEYEVPTGLRDGISWEGSKWPVSWYSHGFAPPMV